MSTRPSNCTAGSVRSRTGCRHLRVPFLFVRPSPSATYRPFALTSTGTRLSDRGVDAVEIARRRCSASRSLAQRPATMRGPLRAGRRDPQLRLRDVQVVHFLALHPVPVGRTTSPRPLQLRLVVPEPVAPGRAPPPRPTAPHREQRRDANVIARRTDPRAPRRVKIASRRADSSAVATAAHARPLLRPLAMSARVAAGWCTALPARRRSWAASRGGQPGIGSTWDASCMPRPPKAGSSRPIGERQKWTGRSTRSRRSEDRASAHSHASSQLPVGPPAVPSGTVETGLSSRCPPPCRRRCGDREPRARTSPGR